MKKLYSFIFIISLTLHLHAQQWERLSPKLGSVYNQIKFIDDTTCFLVGDNGLLARSTDAGKTWIKQKNIKAGLALTSMDFINATTGYAIEGTLSYKTTDRGITWTEQNRFAQGKIRFISSSTGVIGGGDGIYKTVDSAVTWNPVPIPDPNKQISDISFVKDTGFAVGTSRFFVTTDGGSTWQKISDSIGGVRGYFAVFAVSPKIAYTVGMEGLIVKYNAKPLLPKDTLKVLQSGTTEDLNAVYFTSLTTGYAVGNRGCILKTTDEGKTWVALKSNVIANFRCVYFTTDQTGYITGENGALLKTTNGGDTWEELSPHFVHFFSVCLADPNTIYVAGINNRPANNSISVMKSEDGGKSWIIQKTGLYLHSITFTSPMHGVAVGEEGAIIKTVDGGKNWTTIQGMEPIYLFSVKFINPQTGFICGGLGGIDSIGVILKTEDGGSSWNKKYVKPNISLRDIWFINADTGFAVGEAGSNKGLILKTTDGGNTWNDITPTFPSLNYLLCIHFVNSKIGFAGGMLGTFLKTIDGGKNWTSINYFQTLNYWENIISIHFLDEKRGYLGFGNLLMESADGGQSWKELSIDKALPSRFYSIAFSPTQKTGFAVGTTGNIQRYTDTSSLFKYTWPGDADNNKVVTNDDLLPLGLFYGMTGSSRSSISNAWAPQLSTEWILNQKNDANLKHVDCNGDGIINANDTLAIHLNFNQQHAKPQIAEAFPADPFASSLAFHVDKPAYAPGAWIDVQLIAGASGSPVDLYGISFDLNYNASLVEPGSEQLIFANSWLNQVNSGSGRELTLNKIDASTEMAYGAITRTNKTNANHFGAIATFRFQIRKDIAVASVLKLSYMHYKATDALGNTLLFSPHEDSVKVDPALTGVKELDAISDLNVYPNPYKESTLLSYRLKNKSAVMIELYNALGQRLETIINELQPAGSYSYIINTAQKGLPDGIYFIKLKLDNEVIVRKIVGLK